MLLGKRSRPPIKRTTSITEFTLDLSSNNGESQPFDPQDPLNKGLDQRFVASVSVSPTNHRRNSIDHIETADFLRACFLCKRRLIPVRDIYMYRGDSAFCSLECRQQQMKQDERKEKCSSAISKKEASSTTTRSTTTTGPPQVSTKGETVAAV